MRYKGRLWVLAEPGKLEIVSPFFSETARDAYYKARGLARAELNPLHHRITVERQHMVMFDIKRSDGAIVCHDYVSDTVRKFLRAPAKAGRFA